MHKSLPGIAAFTLAVGAHLGLAVFLATPDTSEGAKAEGAQGIEIDLGMLGDLGTDVIDKTAQAEPEPQPAPKPEPEPEPQPEPEPVQKPELKVKKPEPKKPPEPRPEPEPEPVEPKPETKPEPKQVKEESSEQGADEVSRQRTSTGQANASSAGGSTGAVQSYYAKLAAQLAANKEYPRRARRRGHEGVVTLAFEVSRDGRVLESRIVKSSGYATLDRAVMQMLERAAPLPRFTPDMQGRSLRIELPVEFSLKHG